MRPSEKSLELWLTAFAYLQLPKIEDDHILEFLRALERLRLEIEARLIEEKKRSDPEAPDSHRITPADLRDYYHDIYTTLGIKAVYNDGDNDGDITVFGFISKQNYDFYMSLVNYVSEKAAEGAEAFVSAENTDNLSLEHSIRFIKTTIIHPSIGYFLPEINRITTKKILLKHQKLIDDYVNYEFEVARNKPLPQNEIEKISNELKEIEQHLQSKYDDSWFKLLRKDILAKKKIVSDLETIITHLDSPTSKITAALIETTIRGQVSHHRDPLSRASCMLFFPMKTDTAKRLYKLKNQICENEDERVWQDYIAASTSSRSI